MHFNHNFIFIFFFFLKNQLEKLEAAKAAWLVCLSYLALLGSFCFFWVLLDQFLLTLLGFLLSLTEPYWALLGLTGPYWVLLGLTEPYWALLGFTGPYWALLGDLLHLLNWLTNVRTLQLIGLLSQPKSVGTRSGPPPKFGIFHTFFFDRFPI